MKVLVKNLKGEVSEIETDSSDKILGVKEKIKLLKDIDVATQKLVYKGKPAADDSTLEQLGFKEGEFMVLMISKAKPVEEPKKQEEKPKETTQVKTETVDPPKTETKSPEKKSDTKQESPPKTVGSLQDSASLLLQGEEYNKTVDEICSMGFEKAQVVKALKAAFNNPDRAIDYLFNGIPENVQPVQTSSGGGRSSGSQIGGLSNPGNQQTTQQTQNTTGGSSGGSSGGSDNPLAFLLNDPNFPRLRAAIQQNPALLQPLLASIGQANPQVLQLITQNQEAFLRLLMEGGPSTGGSGGSGGSRQPGNVIRLTHEEKAAVDRLVEFGFDQRAALEAYLACDKDESLAANYLFENQAEFFGDVGGGQGGSSSQQQGGNTTGGNQNSGNQGGSSSGGPNQPSGDQGTGDKNDDDDNLFS